ncbi:hypothetical protein ABFX02_08G124700 [Erythranthe guttata]
MVWELNLKLDLETGIHETIGIDLVVMRVNDTVNSGAKPKFRLDYFGASSLDFNLLEEKVTKRIVNMCQLEGEGSRREWPFVERTNSGDHILRYMKALIHKVTYWLLLPSSWVLFIIIIL